MTISAEENSHLLSLSVRLLNRLLQSIELSCTFTCRFQRVSYVKQFLKDEREFVLALYQEANSKQTRETKARAGPVEKRGLVSGLEQLLQIGQRKEGWEGEE